MSGRRYLPLYEKQGAIAFVHLHVFQEGAAEIATHLGFRDYLRSHPVMAEEYNSLKLKLSDVYVNKRELYTQSKNDFIQKIIALTNGERYSEKPRV